MYHSRPVVKCAGHKPRRIGGDRRQVSVPINRWNSVEFWGQQTRLLNLSDSCILARMTWKLRSGRADSAPDGPRLCPTGRCQDLTMIFKKGAWQKAPG